MNRREFLTVTGALAAGCATTAGTAATTPPPVESSDPFLGTNGKPVSVGAPNLQAPGETTMGISWKVSGLCKGVVEYSPNPNFKPSQFAKTGGYGIAPIDVAALQVRLEHLKPATRYFYRTITTPFTDYKRIYDAKLGEPIISPTYSFVTLGTAAPAHFCVMSDTHAQWEQFEAIVRKVKSLNPSALVWNGDATNTTQKKSTAVEIFLDPPIADRDYATSIPVFFTPGNHDYRGSWISRKDEVLLPRHPAERRGDQWDLKWNFAVRLGELALIGMDTGEDKPDAHPKWFGLANFEPYRRAQAKWLEEQLARPEIAAAKFKVLFCHIPLFAAPDHPDYPHDGIKVDPVDYAYWSRECHELWSPIIERAGVQLVLCGHKHKFRFDPPSAGRHWTQIVGGGRCKKDAAPDTFPTVIECKVENGKLRMLVHNVLNGQIVFDRTVA